MKRPSMTGICAAMMVAGLLGAAAPATAQQTPGGAAAQRQDIEAIVRDYLLRHPEVILEAVENYKRQVQEREQAAARQAVTARLKEIQNDPDSPVSGNPAGDVTMVEFFDYRCGYCKGVHRLVGDVVKSDGRIRFVYKEFPILGPDSVIAARAALAARKQGKYVPFHNALMEHRGNLGAAEVLALAAGVGLDAKKLQKDMQAPEIDAILRRNFELAEALKINGTPAFVIGTELLPGAPTADTLRAVIEAARKKS